MTAETETIAAVVGIVVVVASGVVSLPWTDRELRSSARAMGTLAALPALALWSWVVLRSVPVRTTSW